MEVNKDFKKTELGVVPSQWDIKPLSQLSEKIMVGIASAATHAYRTRGIPMFRNQNIKPGYLNDSEMLYISEEYESTYKNKRLKTNDLLTARTGYPGTTGIVPEKYEGAQSFTTLITRPKTNLINVEYLNWYINSPFGQRFFEQNQIGGGQKNVNAGSLKKLPVLIPTPKEQEAIANALSDTDSYIESLEKLIAKKRLIKRGVMQELLTGRKRLSGKLTSFKITDIGQIPSDWEVKTFADIGETLIGLTYKPSDVKESGTLVLRSSNIQNDRLAFKNNVFVDMSIPDRAITRKDDLLICVRNGSRQLIGKCTLIDAATSGSAFGAFMSIFRTKHSPFIHYAFMSESIKRQINEVMGATINQITSKDLKSFKIALPTDPKEERLIASVLQDIDKEIFSIEDKLNKAHSLKLGMMQVLLTGRIRLV